jgi:transcriptional regulator with XRE-family HTH domain
MEQLRPKHVEAAGKKNPRLHIEVKHYIRPWREAQRLSMKELAEKSTLSLSAISQLERGRAHYTQESLEKIAAALELPAWVILCTGPSDDWPAIARNYLYHVGIDACRRFIEKTVTDCQQGSFEAHAAVHPA